MSEDMMNAAVRTEYGAPDVLHVAQVPKPQPKPNELLVRVRASSVNYGDLTARDFAGLGRRDFNMPAVLFSVARLSFGWNKPKNPVLGSEFAGIVEAVGDEVQRFAVGDEVFGYRGQRMGCYAEYLCIGEDAEVAMKPGGVSFEEAAVVPYGTITALSLLRNVETVEGERVLIIGASGGIGSAAVQILRSRGARVTGVCGTPRLDFVRELGAEQVIDYTTTDFATGGTRYGLIFDVLGRSSFRRARRVLADRGTYLRASFKLRELVQMLWTSRFGAQKVVCALAPENSGDLPYIAELLESRDLRAIIDRSFPLEEAAAAHRYAEGGHKRGMIAISVAP
jgi:NADPH:quinone reductase-like Zn-dependent oxidoreductase